MKEYTEKCRSFYNKANIYLKGGKNFFETEDYLLAAFNLFQAGEFYYKILSMVFKQQNSKNDLITLIKSVKNYPQTYEGLSFPVYTSDELQIWKYAKGINSDTDIIEEEEITKEVMKDILVKTELLQEITRKVLDEKTGTF